jgi:hypothetical protein
LTTTIEYSAFLDLDYPEAQVDQFGYARLRDKARDQGLTLVGDVTRVHDALVTGIPATQPNGEIGISYVEIGSDLAGAAIPDAKLVRWSITAEPTVTGEAVQIEGAVIEPAKLARGAVPEAVTVQGGLVEFKHGLGGEPVTRAYGDDGEIGYSYGVAIDDNRVEILLPPGALRLESVRDEDEETAK